VQQQPLKQAKALTLLLLCCHALLRFPFYYQVKLLVVLWLIAPQTQVSSRRQSPASKCRGCQQQLSMQQSWLPQLLDE
jgi:hypothetical protein